MMPPATADEIEDILGDADAILVERIQDTRASADEVAEALADFEDEKRLGSRREPATERIAAVREILEELFELESDDGQGAGDDYGISPRP